jgi:hypothetical protein
MTDAIRTGRNPFLDYAREVVATSEELRASVERAHAHAREAMASCRATIHRARAVRALRLQTAADPPTAASVLCGHSSDDAA